MNATHLHLMLNHLPIVGTAFTLAHFVVALWRKSDELKRVSLCFFVLVTVLTAPAYLTGEPAEDAVEKLAGVSKAFIEPHEEAAQRAFSAQFALGVAALGALLAFRHGKPLPNWCATALLVLALAVAGLMARTANLGGLIRHPEIISTPAGPPERKAHHD